MDVGWVDDVDARVAIADLIRSVLPSEGFGSSIGDYVRSDAYTFLIAFADDGPDETLGDAVAVVVFSRYELPMANRAVLGVDALAIRAETLDDALEFLRVLAQIAGRSDLHGVLVAESGVAKPGLVRALVERGRLDAEPIGVLQPLMSSSRSGPPYTAAFLSRSSRPDGTTPGLTPSMR